MSNRSISSGRCLLIVAFITQIIVGCTQQEPPPAEDPPGAAPNESTTATTELKVVDRDGFDAVLAQQQGKVVLVDFWATWCAPCVKQLPHTFEMAAEGQDRGLAVITVCMEDPDDLERIEKFLASLTSANAVNLMSSEGGSSQAMESFEITGGALPHYRLYDRQGELRHTFALDPSAEKQFTPTDIESAVDALLQE